MQKPYPVRPFAGIPAKGPLARNILHIQGLDTISAQYLKTSGVPYMWMTLFLLPMVADSDCNLLSDVKSHFNDCRKDFIQLTTSHFLP